MVISKHRKIFTVLIALLILLFSFPLGKAFLVWATLFVMGLAFSDGSEVPNDPVFDCLKTFTLQALQCYVST